MTNSSPASSRSLVPALRELRAADRAPLERILRATDAFPERELVVAMELIDEGIAAAEGRLGRAPQADDYRFFVAEVGATSSSRESPHVAGYVCFGLAPLTDGVFDLYWIAVDPKLQRGGVGRQLLLAAEREVARLGGRMLLIETGGKPSYAPTRRFYERAGYVELARVPDYFTLGDDKVVFGRRVDGKESR
jgi:GNAT superfamily N-acetyltransferase